MTVVCDENIRSHQNVIADCDAVYNADMYTEIERNIIADDQCRFVRSATQHLDTQSRPAAEVSTDADVFSSFQVNRSFDVAVYGRRCRAAREAERSKGIADFLQMVG